MLFPTFDFLLFLLPVLVLAWTTVHRPVLRMGILLAASYFFYTAGPKTDPLPTPWYFVGLLVFSTLLDYACGIEMARQDLLIRAGSPRAVTRARRTKHGLLVASLVGNLGLLGYFKYTDFFLATATDVAQALNFGWVAPTLHLALPVGISFYTFQSLSYSIDVWRGRLTPERSLLRFALFVTFFPQLVAGPIVRASELLPQFHRAPRFSAARMEEGLFLIFKGLIKKVVLGDWIASKLTNAMFAAPESYTSAELLIALYAFTLQLYADFSGYSDIAIGVARLIGYDLPENFDRPYQSTNLGEFWRRWHMTLSTWLRDYLFFPLGGSRCAPGRAYFNLWLTMFLVGMWHYKQSTSWNFVIYAALHGSAMVFNRWNRQRTRSSLGRAFAPWTVGLTLLAMAVAGFGQFVLELDAPQAKLLAGFSVATFLVVAWLPETGRWWNTVLHVALTFHFTVLSRVFFRAESFAVAKQMCRSLLTFDGHGLRPGLITPWVAVALALGFAWHFTPKSWVDVHGLRWFRKLPGPVLGVAMALLAWGLMELMSGAPQAFIYFQF